MTSTLSDQTERSGTSTVTGIATGTAAADRISVFQFICNPAPASITFNGITVGLVNGTDILAVDLGGGTFHIMAWIRNPTGTTASLVITGSTIFNHGCIAVYGRAMPPFHINGSAAASTTINTPNGGTLIACAIDVPPAAMTWNTLTEDYDYQNAAASARFSMAHTDPTSAATGATVQAATGINTFAVSFSPVLSVVAGAGSYAISGTAATPKVARKVAAAAGSYLITGTAATLRRALPMVAGAGSYSITGSAAALKLGRVTVAAAGSYSISGTAAALKLGRAVIAASGSYAINGTAATLTKSGSNKTLAADAGAYAITGFAATLRAARKVTAGAASYVITGTAATLKYGRLTIGSAGAYAITGTAATLRRTRLISAAGGSYSVSGVAVSLKLARRIAALSGSYSITGTAASLVYHPLVAYSVVAGAGAYSISSTAAVLRAARRATAGAGSYTIAGVAASLQRTWRVDVDAGSYLIEGSDATLTYSAALATGDIRRINLTGRMPGGLSFIGRRTTRI